MRGSRPLSMKVLAIVVCLVAAVPVALAHGLLVSVRSDGTRITGTVYYSNGEPGAGEWVQLFDPAQPEIELASMAAGSDGSFEFHGVEGRHYRITVTGDEGHVVDSEITVAPEARGRFVERDMDSTPDQADDGFSLPPAWALLGFLLVLSMIPAAVSRWRASRARPKR